MLILGDESIHNGRVPWVTFALIGINALVFGLQCQLGEPFTNGFSLVPKEIVEVRDITKAERLKVKDEFGFTRDSRGNLHTQFTYRWVPINHYPGPFPIVLTLFTSIFLHGDFFHLLGNMWFLIVFGRNVECAMNHGRFLAFYAICGTLAGLAHVASDAGSIIPCLGASGAISGVMGAYVAIHPFNKVKLWINWWIGIIEVPALVVIGIWFLFQYVYAFLSLEDSSFQDGTAYWDHVGGFVAGVALVRGTIVYLRWQLAKEEEAGDSNDASLALPPPLPAPDPFATFLPAPPSAFASALTAGLPPVATQPQPNAVLSEIAPPSPKTDPFGSFLPEPSSVPKSDSLDTFFVASPKRKPETMKPLW